MVSLEPGDHAPGVVLKAFNNAAEAFNVRTLGFFAGGGIYVPLAVDADGVVSVDATFSGTVTVGSEYPEDTAHASGDIGGFILGVRNDTPSALTDTNGDYSPIAVTSTGAVRTVVDGNVNVILDEPISVDGAISIAGTVSVTNGDAFPWPVADNGGSLTVDAVSWPLPTGASTLAEQQTQTASLSVMDDWDESDRCKVNPIVGQAGVASNTGVVTAGTQRVTLATNVALPAGTNNIGDVDVLTLPALPAGTNNIGDVDVLSVVPGTGATNLGKAEDAIHATGDVGVMALGVANNSGATFGAEGDYCPIATNVFGQVLTVIQSGTITGISQPIETEVQYAGSTAASLGDIGAAILGIRNDDGATAFTDADQDFSHVAVDDRGRLLVSNTPPGTYYTVDFTASPTTDTAQDISHKPAGLWALQVAGVGGSPTAWQAHLQISLDGTNFTNLLAHVSGTNALGSTVNMGLTTISAPARFFRIFLSNVTPLNLNGATALRVGVLGVPA